MSYVDEIPKDKLLEYEVIYDWPTYFNSLKIDDYSPINIQKKIFKTGILFTGGFTLDISFNNCYFTELIGFTVCEFERNFTIADCFIDTFLSAISGPIVFKGIFMVYNTKIKNVYIQNGEFDNCIWEFSDCKSVVLMGGEYKSLQLAIGEGGIENINVFTKSVKGSIHVIGSSENDVGTLKLEGFSKDLTLSIVDLKVGFFWIDKYRNEDGLRLVNMQPISSESKVTILESYLGKAEFTAINFSKFDSLIIDNSHVVDCAFNNVIWSSNMGQRDIKLDEKMNDNERERYYLGRREVFRQLKYAMSKQGDIINEQKFHSIEMLAHYRMLRWGKDFWTKLIIKLSFITSDFGQSFSRPLLLIFVFHTALFLPLIFSGFFKDFEFSLTHLSWGALGKGIGCYFFLINPFRKVDEGMFNGAWILIDILMRIPASYMIYNMVRATRRFIK